VRSAAPSSTTRNPLSENHPPALAGPLTSARHFPTVPVEMEIDMTTTTTTTVKASGRSDRAPQLSVARVNLMRGGYLLMGVGLAT